MRTGRSTGGQQAVQGVLPHLDARLQLRQRAQQRVEGAEVEAVGEALDERLGRERHGRRGVECSRRGSKGKRDSLYMERRVKPWMSAWGGQCPRRRAGHEKRPASPRPEPFLLPFVAPLSGSMSVPPLSVPPPFVPPLFVPPMSVPPMSICRVRLSVPA